MLPISANVNDTQLEEDEIAGYTEYSYLGVIFDKTGKNDKERQKPIAQSRRKIGRLNGVMQWTPQTTENLEDQEILATRK